MALALEHAKRRRMVGKQPPPASSVLPPPALAALVDEAWSELTALSDDSRRKHVHWVHARTTNAAHIQPERFTREEFWQHLCRVYKDVYPRPEHATGSILLFGCVAKERHAASPKEPERHEHHHCPCYTQERHYWAPVARRSLELGVKLHAACHNGYTMMYVYVRCPSPKKPLAELDQGLWHSPDHPQGHVLQQLLQAGAQATRRFHQRRGDAADAPARFRANDMYALVKATNVRTVQQLQVHAHAQAQLGDTRLAEFCTIHKADDLQAYLDGAWGVHDAPARAVPTTQDRVAKLHTAAASACTCGGTWTGRITFVLENNAEDKVAFATDVYNALSLGACRGTNLAISGPPGCGKRTVFEALDLIYEVSGKPQRESSFPFAGVLDAEVLLWQEFTWTAQLCAFEDLLSLMAGEKFGIREPNKKPRQFRNTSPMFYTAWEPLTFRGKDPHMMATYNQAMGERFKTRRWTRPLPAEGRLPKFPHCACCFAKFILTNASR